MCGVRFGVVGLQLGLRPVELRLLGGQRAFAPADLVAECMEPGPIGPTPRGGSSPPLRGAKRPFRIFRLFRLFEPRGPYPAINGINGINGIIGIIGISRERFSEALDGSSFEDLQ